MFSWVYDNYLVKGYVANFHESSSNRQNVEVIDFYFLSFSYQYEKKKIYSYVYMDMRYMHTVGVWTLKSTANRSVLHAKRNLGSLKVCHEINLHQAIELHDFLNTLIIPLLLQPVFFIRAWGQFNDTNSESCIDLPIYINSLKNHLRATNFLQLASKSVNVRERLEYEMYSVQ